VAERATPTTAEAVAAARAEAEERAHDRVAPDATLDAIAAVNLYVEAFLAGARFAATRRESDGRDGTGNGR
jgi:hypothetical protein